ncbi:MULTISPECIES: PA1136 family autoinducer-binding transcriptional regulator [Pseudomonas]|uniref:PA1136 family autoinducer-binding transcriptional regulator n=1 Tax=Pseudomonas TaxID=286 RepID=UPI0015A2A906|nr:MULTISPECIES: PA1136 family autoinducer-binding transcriptional regulator [Pseudomonas]NVZ88181.1 autoinducer binding domain-containing protein [Pseudomonas yamanorum]NWB55125.1 autoinducer binding domain-containing protein [Pseudomonas sp. F8002]NWD85668.1 autoinducer binding domain-containing protein [Pseudomonas sp. K5002]
MTDFAKTLFESVAQARRAPDAKAVCQCVIDFSAKLGFDRVIICGISPRPTVEKLIEELFFVHGEWIEGCSADERDAYLLHCPITKHILETEEPFFWSKSPSRNSDKMTYRIVRGVRDLGRVNGIQVPIFGRAGLEGAFSFAAEDIDLSHGVKFSAQAFCSIAFLELKRHRGPGTYSEIQSLTKRELEVLQWIALGKSQAHIATIMMISERTVENHLRAARHRLGASSTAHAVAQAMKLGDIEI